MKKVTDAFKWFLSHPIISLGLLYFHWFLFYPSTEDCFHGLKLLSIALVIEVLAKVTKSNKTLSFILLIFAFPAVLLSFLVILYFGVNVILFSYVRELQFFVIGTVVLSVYPLISYSKDILKKDNVLQKLLLLSALTIIVANFSYYVEYRPYISLEKRVGVYHYIVASERLDNFSFHEVFYKCKTWGFDCDALAWSYGWFGAQIIHDEANNEVSLLSADYDDGFRMIYTDGENPISYAYFTSAKLGDHYYFLSKGCPDTTTSSCRNYIYSLMRCNLEYKACVSLPIQYADDDFGILILEGDERTHSIELYDGYRDEGGTLVFSYGEAPQCFVDGCEILDE